MLQPEWIMGLAGGLIIGTAGAVYLLANGRIMGALGILGGLIDGSGMASAAERSSFLAGLIALPALIAVLGRAPETHLTGNWVILIVSGLLVGVGTRLANGCTSGHGVCGISRLSLRGIVATVFYILAGGVAVLLFKHVWGVV